MTKKDDDETIKDGQSIRVSLTMMDSMQREIAPVPRTFLDARGKPKLALCDYAAAAKPKDERPEYEANLRRLKDAWRTEIRT